MKFIPHGKGLSGKQKARIWRALVKNVAPIIRAIAALIEASLCEEAERTISAPWGAGLTTPYRTHVTLTDEGRRIAHPGKLGP